MATGGGTTPSHPTERGLETVKGMKRFRRQMVATGAALGIAAAVVGTAAAADQVNYITVPSAFSQPLGITAGPGGILPIDCAPGSANQRLPSGPAVMPSGCENADGTVM